MAPIRVMVTGPSGKMGREVIAALCKDPDTQPVGALSRTATAEATLDLPDGSGAIPVRNDADILMHLVEADVLVDFSNVDYTMPIAQKAFEHGLNVVTGTTGLAQEHLDFLHECADMYRLGALWAPNFALGAVVLIRLAAIASKYFDYAEIIEQHHEMKADAPSGTAIATAKAMAEARGSMFDTVPTLKETLPHARGSLVEGIPLHSVRLPGLLAHEEVLFGTAGQTLRLRHDTISRECYMPGVLLAVKEVMKFEGLKVGLENVLGLP